MDFLINCLLMLLLTVVLVQRFCSVAGGSKSSGKLPPGPKPMPIIGNLLHLGKQPHKSLAKLAKIHGPLMTLKLGQVTTVVISSTAMAEEVLQTHDITFSNRTVIDAVRACQHHKAGLPWLPISPAWRNLRKICSTYLFTSQKLDANRELRRQKVQELLADVQESCRAGKAIDVGQAAFKTTLNLLSNAIFSLDLADPSADTAREFKELTRGIMEEAGKPNLADYFPVLRRIDLQGIRSRMAINFRKLYDLFDRMINERLQLRKDRRSITTNDFLDSLLRISQDGNQELQRSHINCLLLDLFVAGTDTTSSTLEWAMAELLHNPQTLSKARAELQRTIGKGNLVDESDITRLPYLQAIVKETFRLHPAVPLLLPRETGTEVQFCGFTVPKDAQVFVNVWAIGRDPNSWENPNSFVPERFLGSGVDVRGRNFELLPFGAGRRICPGLPLALRMLHLMLGSLVHSFDWKLEDGLTPEAMDMEEKLGITLQKAQSLRAIPM